MHPIRTVIILVSVLTALSGGHSSGAETENPLITRLNPIRYRIVNGFEVTNTTKEPQSCIVMLPHFQSNMYQDIEYVNTPPGVVHPALDDEGLMLEVRVDDVPPGEKRVVRNEVIATIYDIRTDFDKITELYPYDTESGLYKRYTRNQPPYIDLENGEMIAAYGELSGDATDILDYARKAFDYSVKNISYQLKKSQLLPLEETLRTKSGDCSNKNAHYITLLRMHGIPARHVTGNYMDNEGHSRSEFYLEKYGWLPTDTSLTKHNSSIFDYFFGMLRNVERMQEKKTLPMVVGFRGTHLRIPHDEHGFLDDWIGLTSYAANIGYGHSEFRFKSFREYTRIEETEKEPESEDGKKDGKEGEKPSAPDTTGKEEKPAK